ncbi:MAG: hypothetical protein ACKOJ9_10810 [Actinomycetota bacterium]
MFAPQQYTLPVAPGETTAHAKLLPVTTRDTPLNGDVDDTITCTLVVRCVKVPSPN